MISLENIEVSVGAKCLLNGLSAEILPGRITGILGPNGAGKTTLLRVLSGEIKPNMGRIMLGGRDLLNFDASTLSKYRACLGQTVEIAFPFTVREVIGLGGGSIDEQNPIKTFIDSLEVEPLLDRLFETLSGGEKQRVQCARVATQLASSNISREKQWLFLDEPTSKQDIKYARSLYAALKNLTQTGMGVVIIIHDITAAALVVDDVLLLNTGCIHSKGTAKEALTVEALSEVFEVDMLEGEVGGERIFTAPKKHF